MVLTRCRVRVRLLASSSWRTSARGAKRPEFPFVSDRCLPLVDSPQSGVGSVTKFPRFPEGIEPLGSGKETIMSDGSAGTVVLVHGGFVDGSGWQGVYQQLTKDGFAVSVVQNPTLSHADDVAATKRVIDAVSEPVILVGHSYGGAVITEAGTDPNVKALVYIAAFMPDAGESVQTLIADLPAETGPPILPPQDGFLLLDRAKFHQAFAGDVDAELAEFMADSQVAWGLDAAGGAITEPAWRSKPSWYLVTTDDRMIPPSLQREMSERAGSTVVETSGSHSIYVSQPTVVADLIERAASEVESPAMA